MHIDAKEPRAIQPQNQNSLLSKRQNDSSVHTFWVYVDGRLNVSRHVTGRNTSAANFKTRDRFFSASTMPDKVTKVEVPFQL